MTSRAHMLGKNIEVYLVGAAGVETTFWVTKLGKWVAKMSFSHSDLVTPLELLLGGKNERALNAKKYMER